MLIEVSWGYRQYASYTVMHWQGDYKGATTSEDLKKAYVDEGANDEWTARSFVRWLESKGFKRVNIPSIHFDAKGRQRKGYSVTGIDEFGS